MGGLSLLDLHRKRSSGRQGESLQLLLGQPAKCVDFLVVRQPAHMFLKIHLSETYTQSEISREGFSAAGFVTEPDPT